MKKKAWFIALVAAFLLPATVAGAQTTPTTPPRPDLPVNVPGRGLIYDGLEKATQGLCRGLYRVKTVVGLESCTHGPDAAPDGVDVAKSVPPVAPGDAAPGAGSIQCSGDGVSGKRVQVMYVRSSDRPDRYATYLSSIRQWAIDADTIYNQSAAETGGIRRVRYVHDANCVLSVLKVTLGTTADDSFANTESALRALGYTSVNRKYMIFMDANVICGQGNIKNDDQPGAANTNNSGPSFARTDAGCWGGSVAAHELMHNIGGVQLSAPHASGGWHCVDESDRMCYSDYPNYPAMQVLCPSAAHEQRFDCKHDDYYNTTPKPGSYLATKWNSSNSQYLIPGAQAVWGYVWANVQSGVPSTTYSFNSKGGANSIVKNGVGNYTVTFGNLAATGGMVHVSTYGATSHSCKTGGWGVSGANEIVQVRCYTTAGAPVDTTYTVSFEKPIVNPGPIGYVWADQAATALNVAYTPSPTWSFNSTGGANSVTRTGTGAYTVRLNGLGVAAGHVQVTPYGTGTELCKVLNWGPTGADQLVRVQCYAAGGTTVNTRFNVTYSRNLPILGVPVEYSGYVWADQPSVASYTPAAAYQFNSVGGSNTIARTAVGTYTVNLPSLGTSGGHVQVTAYGAGSNECKVSSWGPSGTTQKVNVRCVNTAGAAADSYFTMNYMR